MNNNITELKRKLERIYNDWELRCNPSQWNDVVEEAYRADPDAAAVTIIDFLQLHSHIPSVVVRGILKITQVWNHPAKMTEIYSLKVMSQLYHIMVNHDPVDYTHLPEGCTDERIDEIAGIIEEAETFIRQAQLYRAEKAVRQLRSMDASNPNIERLAAACNEIRATGGVPADVLVNDRSSARREEEILNRGLKYQEEGRIKEAAAYYQKLISEDYQNYRAFLMLGSIYYRQGENEKADYIADLLLELGECETEARLLKGRILEAKDQMEDALFYYETAYRSDLSSREAFAQREQILSRLDHVPEELRKNRIRPSSQYRKSSRSFDLRDMRINPVIAEATAKADDMMRRGRPTEAYYELSRISEKYSVSSFLTFKKAFALYQMKRYPEARSLLKEIPRSDLLYEKAGYLIEDIDHNILDNKRFSDLTHTDLAEILFTAGQFEKALSRLDSADVRTMKAADWALKGRCEIELGMLHQAEESFRAALSKDRRYNSAREILALIYQVQNENEKALEMYDAAINLSSDPEDLCIMKAALLCDMNEGDRLVEFRKSAFALVGHYSDVDAYAGLMLLEDQTDDDPEAFRYLEGAVAGGSQEIRFYKKAFDHYIQEGFYHQALVCAESGIQFAGASSDLFQSKAEALFWLGRLNSAEMIVGMLLSEHPDSAPAQFLMGSIQQARGKLSSAAGWFESAVENDPDNHHYTFVLAEVYLQKKNDRKANEFFTAAIRLNPDDYISYKRRAEIHSRAGEDEKALDDINYALLIKPDDPELYILLGNIISGYAVFDENEFDDEDSIENIDEVPVTGMDGNGESSGKTPISSENFSRTEAVKTDFLNDIDKDPLYYYSRAISIDPKYVEAYVCRAKSYAEQGRTEEALKDIDAAIAIQPDSARLHTIRGVFCHMAGQNEDAVRNFGTSVQLDSNNLIAYSYISKCSNALGKYTEAVSAAERGIEVDPEFSNLYVNRGVAYFHLERYEDAIEDFNRVIMKKNESSTAALETSYKYKGLSYEKLGKKEDAVSNYRMLLRYNPQASGIRDRVETLEEEIHQENPKSFLSVFRKWLDR